MYRECLSNVLKHRDIIKYLLGSDLLEMFTWKRIVVTQKMGLK